MDAMTARFNEENAAKVAARYENVTSPMDGYFGVAFSIGSRILDICACSGKAAARLQANGHDVFGIDPSKKIR